MLSKLSCIEFTQVKFVLSQREQLRQIGPDVGRNRRSGGLQKTEIGEVEALNLDTYADPERFYSYRRATHRGEADYGRQLSAIALPG